VPAVIDQVVMCVRVVSMSSWMRVFSSPGFSSEMSWPC